jgi:hypothetical protein
VPARSHSIFLSAALCAVLFIAVIARAADLSQTSSPTPDPLVQLLLDKGVITSAEADALRNGSAAERQTQLLKLLRDKGVLSATDYDSLTTPPAPSHVSNALVASTTLRCFHPLLRRLPPRHSPSSRKRSK